MLKLTHECGTDIPQMRNTVESVNSWMALPNSFIPFPITLMFIDDTEVTPVSETLPQDLPEAEPTGEAPAEVQEEA